MLDDLSIIDISLLAAYMQHECLNIQEALSPFSCNFCNFRNYRVTKVIKLFCTALVLTPQLLWHNREDFFADWEVVCKKMSLVAPDCTEAS